MKRILIVAGMCAFLAACGTKETPKEVPVTDSRPTPTQTTTPPPTTTGTGTQTTPPATRIDPLKDPANPLSKRMVYFDYDKDVVKPEFQSLVQAHANFLAQNRTRKVRLEGHADERGSREYNMALGQRRADAVRKALSVLGVANERMETISFGEDKPAAAGQNEAAWAQNRRVEIRYDGE